jgi:putative PIN family toxin of toxin-antitoxin system
MRLVLDTNTALSGLLWGGPPGQLLDAAEHKRIELISSVALLKELAGVLARDKFARQFARRGLYPREAFDGYAALVACVSSLFVPRVIAADPADDHVIACAIAAHADIIVSGDRHLLDIGSHYQDIAILPAQAAVEHIGRITSP